MYKPALSASSPYLTAVNSSATVMLKVMLACLPGVLVSSWFFGYGLMINIIVAAAMALCIEASVLKLCGKPVGFHLRDNSALLSAILLAIALPPGSSWWLIALGIGFSLVIAKHLYGGLGQNLFNPAMCGYAFLLISFPLEMTSWHLPDSYLSNPLSWHAFTQALGLCFPFLSTWSSSLNVLAIDRLALDGLAMATPLVEHKLAGNSMINQFIHSDAQWSTLFSRNADTGWELVNIAFLIGGLILLYQRIISWRIPVSILLTVFLLACIFYSDGTAAVVGSPYLHIFGSATIFGAFFIATDPVSAASTARGKIIYGIIIGVAIYSIRVWGSYLDSVAFAVLFGNFCVPLIDYMTRPLPFGHNARLKL